MIRHIGAGLLLLCAAALSAPQNDNAVLQSLVETEREFAQTSVAKGTRPAFMAFIADDGIMFRPGPVKGKEWMQANPLPAEKKRSLLNWQPIFADVAQSGEMGYTTGPWEFKDDINDEKPSAFGHFVTVWKKQVDGAWRFAVDLGITHPALTAPVARWEPASMITKTKMSNAAVKLSSLADLMAREREFSAASATKGFREAFASYASPDVRLYRNDSYPVLGIDAAIKALPPAGSSPTWEPADGAVSRAGDLGYSYGRYEARDGVSKSITEKGNYLRIWKRDKADWRVVLDLTDPLPK